MEFNGVEAGLPAEGGLHTNCLVARAQAEIGHYFASAHLPISVDSAW